MGKELGMQIIQVDELLVNVLVKSTRDGLAMAGLKPLPVGVSRLLRTQGEVTAIVGFAGGNNGCLTLNASRDLSCHMAGKMLGEDTLHLTPEAMDGVCEIANIIAGQTKALLSTTDYKIERISVPSVVVGSNYCISHYKGMQTITVDFQLPDYANIRTIEPGVFSVCVCLMKS